MSSTSCSLLLDYPLRALVPWFLVFVLRTRISIHVLVLDLSLILGTFLVLDSFSKTLPLGFTALAMHLTILCPRLHVF